MGCCSKGPPAPPHFVLTANIWFGQQMIIPPVAPPNLAAVPCQIAPGELIFQPLVGQREDIKFPKLTNVHFQRAMPLFGNDLIECPAGSGMWYTVTWVFDVGKGFPNEYRACSVLQVAPIPDPLP